MTDIAATQARRLSTFVVACVFLQVGTSHAEEFAKLDEAIPAELFSRITALAPVFDFDEDGCLPAAGISRDGQTNAGLEPNGAIVPLACRRTSFLDTSNTMHRHACAVAGGDTYCGHLYGLYFEKDEADGLAIWGHRHDFEYAIIWTKNDALTHASVSQHGEVETRSASNLPFDGTHVKVVYHKDGPSTHVLRFAGNNEVAENSYNTFVTPTIASWFSMTGDNLNNRAMRIRWNDFDSGNAIKDHKFLSKLNQFRPSSYPELISIVDASGAGDVDENLVRVDFVDHFFMKPAVFASMQTHNGGDPANLRISAVDWFGFDVFVQEEESLDTETDHALESIGILALEEGAILDAGGARIGEVSVIERSQWNRDTWFSVPNLDRSYTDPVVIMMLNSTNGTESAHIRLKNVSSSSFQYQIEEWLYQGDGYHSAESLAFMVVEAGVHALPDGRLLQAQKVSVDLNFSAISFAQPFADTPVVLSQSQTYNGADPVVTRQKDISMTGLQLKLQEEEARNASHNPETVGVVSVGW